MTSPKRIIVVGASSGIGAEIAKQYAAQKTKLMLAARREERLKKLCEECKKLGAVEANYVVTDVTVEQQIIKLIDETVKQYGGIDIVQYVAGVAMHCLFHEITNLKAVMSQIMDVNFTGSVYCIYHCQQHLKKSKGQFVAVSSVAGEISPPFSTLYAAAKHAMDGFFEALQNENPGYGVTIVCPGYVETEIGDKKIVGDGSVKSVPLDLKKSQMSPMSAETAAKLIIDATAAKKTKYHLTTGGSLAAMMKAIWPSLINRMTSKEMFNISNVKETETSDNKDNTNQDEKNDANSK